MLHLLITKLRNGAQMNSKKIASVLSFLGALVAPTSTYAQYQPYQSPLFLETSVQTMLMLNMSKDHRLFYKAYDDYTNLTGNADGKADTTYVNDFDYYGYFDSNKCYVYKNDRFEPSRAMPIIQVGVKSKRVCNSPSAAKEWSGNFLNWATMTRIDVVRKMLYGGFRSTDTPTETVLERSFLPNDAHAFVKYYNETDLGDFTPYGSWPKGLKETPKTGISICNLTPGTSGFSQDNVNAPVIRVAKGNYSLWASNERKQCQWYGESHESSVLGSNPWETSKNPKLGLSFGNKFTTLNPDTDSEMHNKSLNLGSNGNLIRIDFTSFTDLASDQRFSGIYAWNDNAPQPPSMLLKSTFEINKPNLNIGNYIRSFPNDGNLDNADNVQLNVRVKVCVPDLAEKNCKFYGVSNKPTGLLHNYSDSILFGLMTGSYTKNKSGGVLRKKFSDFNAEVASKDGTFTKPDESIVKTLDALRIYGYDYGEIADNGDNKVAFQSRSNVPYGDSRKSVEGSDNCQWGATSFVDGNCTNWGNPQAEIYLESLRYIAGLEPTPAFNVDGVDKVPNLTNAKWGSATAPLNKENYCAPVNIVQFNASTTSYDADQLSSTGFTGLDIAQRTNDVGNLEKLTGSYFVGKTGTTAPLDDQLCTPKPVGNNQLASVSGTCPDAPRLEGSYNIAGLANFARNYNFNPNKEVKGKPVFQSVRTFGVALEPSIPKVDVPVPGNTSKKITILPGCRSLPTYDDINQKEKGPSASNAVPSNCTIVDFKIINQEVTSTKNSGKLYVNWEDTEQGGDYDQDMWGILTYSVTASEVTITTQVYSAGGTIKLGFGYSLGGTGSLLGGKNAANQDIAADVNKPGDTFHVHSGTNGFNQYECQNCKETDAATMRRWSVASDPKVKSLEPPLYYAAKWGGYSATDELLANQAIADGKFKTKDEYINSISPNGRSYFNTLDPKKLEESMKTVFALAEAETASASAVATVSAKIEVGSAFYQAQFKSRYWYGNLTSYLFDAQGLLGDTPKATSTFPLPASRKIKVAKDDKLFDFTWDNLSSVQQKALQITGESSDALAKARVLWLRGDPSVEFDLENNKQYPDAKLRSRYIRNDDGKTFRREILGDIVNSSPIYVGTQNYHYETLPEGGTSYAEYVGKKSTKRVWVGSNDGMLHAFDADTLAETFAFIPDSSFKNIAKITDPSYGQGGSPHLYLVDGPIATGDAYFKAPGESVASWHTVLVGTMGAGAKGIFALDITDQDNPKFLWEKTSNDLNKDGTPNKTFEKLGYILGSPYIVALPNNRWGVVFGNGLGDVGVQTSGLYVMDLEDPSKTVFIDTKEGNGLSAPALTTDVYRRVTKAYAGDLAGNMWKFDLSAKSSDGWKADFKLFQAVSADGKPQPISAEPTVGANKARGGIPMVYFGTGKYIDKIDNDAEKAVKSSIYAIADLGAPVLRNSKDLAQKAFVTSGTKREIKIVDYPVSGLNSDGQIDWINKKGWYLDFNDTDAIGERVVSKLLLVQDYLIFPSVVPSSKMCDRGGVSWLMAICAVCDNVTQAIPPLDINQKDFLIVGRLNYGVAKPGATTTSSTSSNSSSSSSSPTCISRTNGSGSGSQRLSEKSTYYCPDSRQSWRQIK